MRRFFLILSLSLVMIAPVMPGFGAALAADEVKNFTLDNGLEVVVIEDHRAPVVVHMVWYRIGAADESPGKSGIAHYLEHLMFKGTDHMAAGELSKTVTANGGMDNAFTSYDYTAYFQRIASDRLDLVMGMEADRMANLRIGEDDWQAERDVVLAERAQRIDSSPSALFAEERRAVQFYNHPYGRPIIGWRAEMEGLTRQDALDWYQAHYAPDNAVLVVAGDVTADEVRSLAEKHYGPIPAAGHEDRHPRPQEPTQRAARHMEFVDARVAQPQLYRSFIVAQRKAGDQREAAALTVLAELLGGSAQTSVLAQKLMLTGDAIQVGAYYDGLAVDPTSFSLVMVPADGLSMAKAEAALDAALADFLEDGVDPAQLARVRAAVHAEQIYARDSAHARAYDYGQGLTTGLTVKDVEDWPALLASVTPEEVEAAAHELLDSNAAVTGWLLPAHEAMQPQTPQEMFGPYISLPEIDRPAPPVDEAEDITGDPQPHAPQPEAIQTETMP